MKNTCKHFVEVKHCNWMRLSMTDDKKIKFDTKIN